MTPPHLSMTVTTAGLLTPGTGGSLDPCAVSEEQESCCLEDRRLRLQAKPMRLCEGQSVPWLDVWLSHDNQSCSERCNLCLYGQGDQEVTAHLNQREKGGDLGRRVPCDNRSLLMSTSLLTNCLFMKRHPSQDATKQTASPSWGLFTCRWGSWTQEFTQGPEQKFRQGKETLSLEKGKISLDWKKSP